MVPTLLAVGFVAGLFPRGWFFIPVAAVGWPIALILTDVDSGVGFSMTAALVGAMNATVGVAEGAGIRVEGSEARRALLHPMRRFLGPETVYGKQTTYKGAKVNAPEVRSRVRFCDTGSGIDRIADIRIELDHANVPAIRFDGWVNEPRRAQTV